MINNVEPKGVLAEMLIPWQADSQPKTEKEPRQP